MLSIGGLLNQVLLPIGCMPQGNRRLGHEAACRRFSPQRTALN